MIDCLCPCACKMQVLKFLGPKVCQWCRMGQHRTPG